MNFTRADISRKAAKKATAAAAKRNHERQAKLGKPKPVCFQIHELHFNTIQKAADMDHRTVTNFVYHAAVVAAERMLARG